MPADAGKKSEKRVLRTVFARKKEVTGVWTEVFKYLFA
jgi:hypothetical protein